MPEGELTTYLFSDIAGSTRLWESDAGGTARALSWHDDLSRATVRRHKGMVVKMTGDGLHAAFDDALAATAAAIELQAALGKPPADMPTLSVRCGLHIGADQRRDGDFFGPAVNRAARIMSAANGGQILLSGALAAQVRPRLPGDVILRDLGLVRLKDLAAPERVFQIVHPLLRSEFPPLRSLASVPNNLPQQLDTFVGREREMAEVRALLAKSRLVTILAFGGVGKSRLALQLGAEILDDYSGGVWLVELAGVAAGGEVSQPVAAVLGVKEPPVGDLIDAIVDALRDRELLLILDNCEHVIDAAARLAKRLLQTSSRLKILATSREALKTAGEWSYPLGTLPVPDARDATPEQLERHASVQLFLDRARAAHIGFQLTARTAATVARICRSLDGIPLALEIAAARLRSMTVETIAARLNEKFALLRSGDGTVPLRQRTLRALIDWSYDLLNESERTAFQRLSVFVGGWTLESAEVVVTGGGIGSSEVLDLITRLAEHSLAAVQAESGRYRMLDTVRHYAGGRLQESADEVTTRERHAAYFAEFVERAHPHLIGADQGEWMDHLDSERENLAAAFAWCERSLRGAELAARLVSVLKYYWLSRGALATGYGYAATAVQLAANRGDVALQSRVLSDAGTIATFLGRYEDARGHLECGLALARRSGDTEHEFVFLQYLSEVESARGNFEVALNYCDAADALASAAGKTRMRTVTLNAKGQLLRVLGRLAEAQDLYEQALAVARSLGDEEFVAGILLNLAIAAILAGRSGAVPGILQEVAAIYARTDSQSTGQSLLEVCGGLAAELQQWDTAAAFVADAGAQALQSGLERDPADQAFVTHITELVSARTAIAAVRLTETPFDLRGAVLRAVAWLAQLQPRRV